ncbi:putative phospholipase [Helianthus annuus]|uniref:Phospholipase n=1 Tax=Helianthus annuus TaxID=4232 RepID=A0A9K3J3Y4_HELAN|nr:putative phospholipase [Helianthus annuus]KAJ0586853.1 putative phospholipase [Helianthus annuus]
MEKLMDKLQKPLVMTHCTSLEEHVDELLKARLPHGLKTEIPTSDLFGPSDHIETEGKVSSESDIICVQGYNVKQSVAPILESIFRKHGDIAADCLFKLASMRSSFLEIVCEAVSRIQTNDDIEEIEQQVVVAEAANINVSCLRVHLDTISANKKCSLLMEMKANMSLVKKAALMDLRESCVELMAAQERFEKAEKCVRVLILVENNINDNILESKGSIDSWARPTVL